MKQYEKNLAWTGGGTVTGRMSSRHPGAEYIKPQMNRKLFHEMYGGKLDLAAVDYAEVERRIAAIYGEDDDLLP